MTLTFAFTEVGFGFAPSPVVGAWILRLPVLSVTSLYVTGPMLVVVIVGVQTRVLFDGL